MEKVCGACKATKPATEFHKDRAKKDGLNLYCKPCQIARQRVYMARPPRRVDPPGMKRCQCCKETKLVENFYAHESAWDGLQRVCKPCSAERYKDWAAKNRAHINKNRQQWRRDNLETDDDYYRKRNYGLPMGGFAKMLAAQGSRCAICRTDTPGTRNFHVDHCHDTGIVRGLLCHHCNVGVGHFKHSLELLLAAGAYLEAGGFVPPAAVESV